MRERVVPRILRRAVAAAAALVVASAAFATADTLNTGDVVGVPAVVDLGAVAPGAEITYDLPFTLACLGTSHVNRDQTLTLDGMLTSALAGSVSATPTTIGPPPSTWPLDGDQCTAGDTPISSNAPSTVTIVAPLTDGDDYLFQVGYTRSYDPVSGNDGTAVDNGMFTFATFVLDVVSNTAPTLVLPSSVTLEGDTTGGATAAYDVSATDAEDDPDPTPSCTPAVGAFVPLGTTHVDCSVTDGGGLTTTGGFDLTVVDTTAPTLAGMPSGVELFTPSATGATLDYVPPTAVDVVDPSPVVACDPAPGSLVPIGDSTVHCTTTDASGNSVGASFPVSVEFLAARWDSPVGGDPPWLIANYGRTVPIKLTLLVGGAEEMAGTVALEVTACGASDVLTTAPMEWRSDSGRWFGHLDTSMLPGLGCYRATASFDGGPGPSFGLDLRGAVETAAPGQAKKR